MLDGGFRKPPEGLRDVIEKVNLVRRERLPPIATEWTDEQDFKAWIVKSERKALKLWLNDRLKGLPQEFREYVTRDDGRWHYFWFRNAIHRYNFVRESRQKLREIARAIAEAKASNKLPVYFVLNRSDSGPVYFDEQWILRRTSHDQFEQALFGEDGAEAARYIRRCQVCDRIFFETRTPRPGYQPGCSPRCSDKIRKQRSRANKPPAKFEMIQRALRRFESDCGKPFQATPKNIQELSEFWTDDATPRQIKRVLDYLATQKKRADKARTTLKESSYENPTTVP